MIWRLEYENAHGDVARLDIQKGDATPVEIIEGTENPFLLTYELEDKNKKGFIMSSFADISIYETATFNIDDLKTLDETALSVKWYINSVLEWTGFVVPDFFSRDIGEPAIVNLAASDRLSALKDATLDGLDEYITLRKLFKACLAKTGLSLSLAYTVDFKADTTNIMDAFALSARLEDDKGKKISCYDVLRSILVLTNSTIRQRKGLWRIYNKIQHEALTPTLNFDEVYQGAKRTIQPVFSSVGAFQEFGGTRIFPKNNSFEREDLYWNASAGGVAVTFNAEFDNRELIYTSPLDPPVFGDVTDKINLINRNTYNHALRLDLNRRFSSEPFNVPFDAKGSADFSLEINAHGAPSESCFYAVTKEYNGSIVSYLKNDGSWSDSYAAIDIRFPKISGELEYSSVDSITNIKSTVKVLDNEDATGISLSVHILGVSSWFDQHADKFYVYPATIRSVKVFFDEISDAKGILYRTNQLGSFSKKSDPETTIFGDFISSGLNGYFYPYSEDESSILHSPLGSNPPLSKWTTATDPAAGELPILQHVTRQMSRMFGVAHNIISAVIDAKTFDPLAIVTNCAGEKYVIVAATFDFLRSTVEVELQQIAYGSLQRRDFIFSYFGGGDGDGISSIGSVSGGGSSSGGGGGGSFLDKYFSFDEANDALVANVSLVSEKEIAAYFSDGSIPSIFDSIPFATSSKVGGIKAASTFKNGIRINSSGFLEVDPSYADSGVSSWSDLTNRPSWLTPLTKVAFEAAHGHTWGQITSKPTTFPPTSHNHPISDVTGLQTALNGKLGTGAQAYDSARLGGQLASKYTRRDVDETITGDWIFRKNDTANLKVVYDSDGTAKDREASITIGRRAESYAKWSIKVASDSAWGSNPDFNIIEHTTSSSSVNRLKLNSEGLTTGNITAQKGTLTSLDVNNNTISEIKVGVASASTATSRTSSILLGRSVATTHGHFWRLQSRSTSAWANHPTFTIGNNPSGGAFTNAFTILNNHNVGLGIDSPTEKLHVVGNGLFTGNITAGHNIVAGTTSALISSQTTGDNPNTGLSLYSTTAGAAGTYGIQFMKTATAGYGTHGSVSGDWAMYLNMNNSTNRGWIFRAKDGGNKASISATGNMQINGNFTSQGEVTAYSSSDIRLKKNIKTIENAIDAINKLNPVQFNWNEKAIELNSAKDSDRVNYGVIAQDIEEVLPDLVHNTNGYKSVDYPQLFGIFIKAIQELSNKIDNK